MSDALAQAREGLRFFRRARRVRREGFRKYAGGPEEMCRAIIMDAYDKEQGYFRVSSGHFCQFYMRDIAFNAEALAALGYAAELRSTLCYALQRYESAGRITTAITPDGTPFDFGGRGPESIALMLRTLRATGNEKLAAEHSALLQKELDWIAARAIGQDLLPKGSFQSLRDQVTAPSSCYNACMIAMAAADSAALGLRFPHDAAAIRERIIATYWNGTYFFNDIRRQPLVIGDPNVFPFWTGVVDDKEILGQAMAAVQAAGLDEPFPLRYISTLDKHREKKSIHLASLFSPGYMTDAIWAHLGLAYIRVLSQIDPARARRHLEAYTRNLTQHGTFLEIYAPDGSPYQTPFYITDEAMVWCAEYLWLAKRMKVL